MTSYAQAYGTAPHRGSLTAVIDRWQYVLMALFLIAVILTGFVPDSFKRLADIGAGGRPDFLPQAHFHALTMGAWMLLLLTQTTLMATGRDQWHKQLGLLGLVLAPLMVVAGVMLVPANIAERIAFAEGGGPDAQAQLAKDLNRMTNTALVQLRSGLCFVLVVAVGLAARGRDAGLHKRMMILAPIAPIGAAFGRMPFLYNSMPESPISVIAWPFLCVVPMLLWDIYRQRSIHRAYWIFAAIMVPTALAVLGLWNSPWWLSVAPDFLYR